MNVPRSDDRLDGLLFEVFAAEAPRPDFSQWEQAHSNAVDELKAAACESAATGSVNPLPLRIGVWIMSHRYARVAVMAAALAGVVVFVGWLSGDGVAPTAHGPGEERPLPPPAEQIAWNRIDTTPVLSDSGGGTAHMRFPPLSLRVAGASAVVLAETTALDESLRLVCRVDRVIYGRVPGDVLHVDGATAGPRARLRAKLRRKPTDDEVAAEFEKTYSFKIGRKVILFLEQGWKPGEPLAYRYRGMVHDVPPKRSLDKTEKEIVEVIRTGSHLSPDVNPVDLGPYLRTCESVVRAKLTKIGERTALWKVEAVLHVGSPDKGGERDPKQQPPPASIVVGLDTWRLRAETIANDRARQQGKPSATRQEVKKEYDRLVGSELRTGNQAILFIRSRQKPGEEPTFKLIAILPDDPENGKPIGQTDAKLREELEKGDWRNRYL